MFWICRGYGGRAVLHEKRFAVAIAVTAVPEREKKTNNRLRSLKGQSRAKEQMRSGASLRSAPLPAFEILEVQIMPEVLCIATCTGL